jgi:hypothetical protein
MKSKINDSDDYGFFCDIERYEYDIQIKLRENYKRNKIIPYIPNFNNHTYMSNTGIFGFIKNLRIIKNFYKQNSVVTQDLIKAKSESKPKYNTKVEIIIHKFKDDDDDDEKYKKIQKMKQALYKDDFELSNEISTKIHTTMFVSLLTISLVIVFMV